VSAPADSGPLRAKGVLVTRPARQAGAFAQKIAVIGGVPIIFPAIVILPPDDAVTLQRAHDALHGYDYAVFVSANAVEFGAPDARRWPASLIAFAPGAGTAEALASMGIHGVRIPITTMDSAGLLALPEFLSASGKRVLVFRGDGGREELGDTLRARGAEVDYVTCYRRARPTDARGLDEAFAASRIDAVTITSSEGLDNLWSTVDAPTRARWSSLPTFVPHERIAAHARDLGLTTALTGPGDAGLVAGLLEWAARNFPQQG
jgi:uroporphyrinogen-III synthase